MNIILTLGLIAAAGFVGGRIMRHIMREDALEEMHKTAKLRAKQRKKPTRRKS